MKNDVFFIGFRLQISTTRSTLLLTHCMRASKALHDKMFNSILYAPMRFFETNQSGRILNRFSKDIGSIDETLPSTFLEAIQTMSDMFGIIIIIYTVNRVMIIVFLVAVLLCSLILKLYLRASQDLKRLEGICEFCNNIMNMLEMYPNFICDLCVLFKCLRSKPCIFTFDVNNGWFSNDSIPKRPN